MAAGCALLTPLNLHTLFLALEYARAQAAAKTLATTLNISAEVWQRYDAAQEAVTEAYRSGSKQQLYRALRALEMAVPINS